jgi:hypothetical protein
VAFNALRQPWQSRQSSIGIQKFQGAKAIDSLDAFLIQYHEDAAYGERQLVNGGRKSVGLTGPHIKHCQGTAFFMERDSIVCITVDSQVSIYAAFFKLMNPDYSRSHLRKFKRNSGAEGKQQIVEHGDLGIRSF